MGLRSMSGNGKVSESELQHLQTDRIEDGFGSSNESTMCKPCLGMPYSCSKDQSPGRPIATELNDKKDVWHGLSVLKSSSAVTKPLQDDSENLSSWSQFRL